MKKILGLLAIVLGLTGCQMNVEPTEETYVVEEGIVSNYTFDAACEMAENISGEASFSDLCKIRDYLYSHTETDDYEIKRDVTFEELKSMLVQSSHAEGLEIANGIKEHGSYLGTFYHRNYSVEKVWVFVAKTGLLY